MDPINPIAGNPEALTQNPVTPETPKDNHGITIAAMAIFVLLALGAVAFLYYQNQQLKSLLASYQTQATTSPSPVTTPDSTANWKTYTNAKLGFSVKMPDLNITLDQSGGNYVFRGGENIFVLGITNQLMDYKNMLTCPVANAKTIPCILSTFDGTKEIRQETIDGHKAVSFRYWYSAGENHTVYQTIEPPFIQLEFNGVVYNESQGAEGTKERGQVLSTFKFTSPSPSPVSTKIPVSSPSAVPNTIY